MKRRCQSPKHKQWARYGGRGIAVCQRWQLFDNFIADMGLRPTGMTLDRIDNDGDYEPGNCRWTTPTTQNRNRSDNRQITINGVTKCLAEWCETSAISRPTFYRRIAAGMTAAGALFTEPYKAERRRELGRVRGAVIRFRHGHTRNGTTTPEYRAWDAMRGRCGRDSHRQWERYGGRGIVVCARWNTFEHFLADVGPRPSNRHSLDRIDNDGNYEPGNVRWTTAVEQNRNKRDSRRFTIGGVTKTVAGWMTDPRTTVCRRTFYRRLKVGMTASQALFTGRYKRAK